MSLFEDWCRTEEVVFVVVEGTGSPVRTAQATELQDGCEWVSVSSGTIFELQLGSIPAVSCKVLLQRVSSLKHHVQRILYILYHILCRFC